MATRTFIMIVDDDPGFVELLRKLLRQHGYTVMLATDGESALKMSRNHSGHIDLLLTDVIMPSMSGPTLAQKLLAQRPHTQVLFMSGMTNAAAIPPDLRERSTFVEKNPPLDGLVQTVQSLLQTH
jgi:two-component system cell cycle sensor histidine kinase/response regulator CckA